MADESKPDETPKQMLDRYLANLQKTLIAVGYAVAVGCVVFGMSWLSKKTGVDVQPAVNNTVDVQPTPIQVTNQVLPAPLFGGAQPVAAEQPVAYTPTFGYVPPGADEVAANLDPAKTLQFSNTDAGRVVQGDPVDTFLWTAVRKAAGKPAPWFPNVNQGDVGSCVGAGTSHAVTVTIAMQTVAGHGSFQRASPEVIYAGSRVEIGGGRLNGDGSVGAWAAKWLTTYGVVSMEVHGGVDLTTYSASRARSWGSTGVPADLEAVAKSHPVKSAALVKTWPDVVKAISQGYAISVCSTQGFSMTRDRDGFAAPQGTWPHCMAIIGIRGGARPGAFILNSWGDNAHTGPVWPADAPVAGFWADAAVVARMVGTDPDSFAYSGVEGFKARRVNWFARTQPRDVLNLRPAREPLYAVAH